VLDDLVAQGILGGLSVESLAGTHDPSLAGETADVVLIAVTEKRTRAELDRYVDVLTTVLS
jgi:glycine cleavage system protein P-like pyridoxal-binding family